MISKKNNRGFALLLALLVSSIVLSIGLSLMSITIKQLALRSNTNGSEDAFQAAAAGLDCLRHLRFEQGEAFTQDGDNISLGCLGQGGHAVGDSSGSSWRQSFADSFDWSVGSENRCIDFDVEVLDATAGARTVGSLGISCENGNICTFMRVRGYNVACGEITGNNRAVTRELTAEF